MVTKIRNQAENNQKETENTITSEPTLETELQLLSELAKVKSRLHTEITEDFTLAKLEEKDKKGIIEMTTNAYYILRLYNQMRIKATKWEFNEQKQEWNQRKLNKQEQQRIKTLGENSFDSLMTRVIMTVIMNRNKPGNDLLNTLAKRTDQKEEEISTQLIQLGDKIKKAKETEEKN